MLVFNEKKYMQGDCLKNVRILCFNIYQIKFIKFLIFISTVMLLFVTAIQTFLFLREFKGLYFKKYMAIYFVFCYFLLCNISVLYMSPVLINYVDNAPKWNLNCVDNHLQKNMKKETSLITLVIIFTIVVELICGILFWIPVKEDREIMFPYAIFEDCFPEVAKILSWIFKITFFVVPFTASAACHQVSYILCHWRLQIYMFLHYLKNINDGFEKLNLKQSISNDLYQNEIKNRLLFCIKRHQIIKNIGDSLLRDMRHMIVVYEIFGALVLGSSLYFVISFQGTVNFILFLRGGTLVIASLITFIHIIIAGQTVENTSSDIFDTLIKLNWYTWNKTNTKMFLTFLINTAKIIQIKFSNETAVNHQMGLSIVKAIYTVGSILFRVKDF